VVADPVPVDVDAVVEVADLVGLGELVGATPVGQGLQRLQLAVVEVGPGGGLLAGPGAGAVGLVGVALALPAGGPEAVGDAPVALVAGAVGAQVQLPGEPVGLVVAELVAARCRWGPGFYDTRIDADRRKRNHVRQLEALGYKVTLQPAV